MRHLKVEIFLEDGFDVFRAHFQRHHASEERPSCVIISVFDFFVNEHIPDISSLGIAREESEGGNEGGKGEDDDLMSKSSNTSLPRS